MTANDAKKIAQEWVMQVASKSPGFSGAFYHGSIHGLSEDSLLPETSDVDLILVFTHPPQGKAGKLMYKGIILDISYLSLDQNESKTQPIEKEVVWAAFLKVKSKGGSAGVDGRTIEQVTSNPKKYLYPIWNRLASGSYHPPAVKQVAIPKVDGTERLLGIPTVCDRTAQMVIREELEQIVEPHFSKIALAIVPRRGLINAKKQPHVGPFKSSLQEGKQFLTKTLHKKMQQCCQHSLKALEKDLTQVNKQLDELIRSDKELNRVSPDRLFNLVTSVEGIGAVTAREILITTNERPPLRFKDFTDAKKYAASAVRLLCWPAPRWSSSFSIPIRH